MVHALNRLSSFPMPKNFTIWKRNFISSTIRSITHVAGVAESADAQDLKSCVLQRRVGSSPTLGTIFA